MARRTENWSEWQFKPGESGQRSFIIDGVIHDAEAVAQSVAAGEMHPLDARLRAEPPELTKLGPWTYKSTTRYARPDGSSDNAGEPGEDPAERNEYSVDFEDMPIQGDRDADGRPILNAAGDPLENPPPLHRRITILRIARFEALYSVDKALKYIDTCNAKALEIPQVGAVEGGTVLPGQAALRVYKPAGVIEPDATYTKVLYELHLLAGGWRWRTMNVGFTGWYKDANGNAIKGKIHEGKAPVQFAVRLKADGTPWEDRYTIEGKTPVPWPQALPADLFETTPLATFLRYNEFPLLDWAPLRLF